MFYVINLRTMSAFPDVNLNTPVMYLTDGDTAKRLADNLNRCVRDEWAYYTDLVTPDTCNGSRGPDYADFVNLFKAIGISSNVHRSDKWQVRKAVETTDWIATSEEKYGKLHDQIPWKNDPAWQSALTINPTLARTFVHLDPENELNVRFIPSAEYGRTGKYATISLHRFLHRYAGLSVEHAKRIFEQAISMRELKTIKVNFASTRKEIAHVYNEGPQSCMKKPIGHWFGDNLHPAEAYAGGDLAIAYIVVDREIAARAVAWPKKKLFSRIYCTQEPYNHLLKALLEKQGYSAGSLKGARLAKINVEKHTGAENSFLIPFIDGPAGRVDVSENGEFFLSEDTGPTADTTNGYMVLLIPYISQKSGKRYSPNYDPPVKVVVDKNVMQTWSSSEKNIARDRGEIFYCVITGQNYTTAAFEKTPVISGMQVESGVKHAMDQTVMCERFKLPAEKSDVCSVVVGFTAGGKPIIEQWSQLARSRYAFQYYTCRSRNFQRTIGTTFFANYLMSAYPHSAPVPIIDEHLHQNSYSIDFDEYVFTEEVNADNAERLKRRPIFKDGAIKFVYPSDAEPKIASLITKPTFTAYFDEKYPSIKKTTEPSAIDWSDTLYHTMPSTSRWVARNITFNTRIVDSIPTAVNTTSNRANRTR